MNSFFAGALAGVQGGVSKYSELQDEQRKYKLDEKKAQQVQARKENFLRFGYKYQDSGMVSQQGRQLSNQEYDGLPDEQKEGTQPGWKAKEDYKQSLNSASQQGKYSKEFDPDTGRPLTYQEVQEYRRDGKPTASQFQLNEQLLDKKNTIAEGKADKKAKTAEEKAAKAESVRVNKGFDTEVNRDVKNSGGTLAEKHLAALVQYEAFDRNPALESNPKLKSALKADALSKDILLGLENKKSVDEIKEQMSKKGISKANQEASFQLLIEQGYFEEGYFTKSSFMGINTGYPGRGR